MGTQDEKDSIYKVTAAIMHSGNVAFRNKPREEQAEADDSPQSISGQTEVSRLLGIDRDEYIKAMCSPKVKLLINVTLPLLLLPRLSLVVSSTGLSLLLT